MGLFGKKRLLTVVPVCPGYIPATNGKRTIVGATSIFKTIDPAFKNLKTDVPGPPRERVHLAGFKLERDETFEEIFKELIRIGIASNRNQAPKDKLLHYPEKWDELCFTQDEIISFVEHDEELRYSKDLVTIMPFACNGLTHVAVIEKRDGALVVNHFLDGYVPKWSSVSHPRFVIPARPVPARS